MSRVYRFWQRVNKDGPEHPTLGKCWQWVGAVINSGYGKLKILAHRLSWIIHNGDIPDGLFVLHRCDNKLCVNPDHLFTGTQRDNSDDKLSKGREARGETQGSVVLTEVQVKEIRRRYKRYSHKSGSGALAREFGVCVTQIWRIAHRKEWRHV